MKGTYTKVPEFLTVKCALLSFQSLVMNYMMVILTHNSMWKQIFLPEGEYLYRNGK